MNRIRVNEGEIQANEIQEITPKLIKSLRASRYRSHDRLEPVYSDFVGGVMEVISVDK
jgi:hypothetical protein